MTTRRDLCLGIAAGTAAAAMAGHAQADDDDDGEAEAEMEPFCPELVGRKVRFLGPNDAMTMDYNPERVNIIHDDDFVVTEVYLG